MSMTSSSSRRPFGHPACRHRGHRAVAVLSAAVCDRQVQANLVRQRRAGVVEVRLLDAGQKDRHEIVAAVSGAPECG